MQIIYSFIFQSKNLSLKYLILCYQTLIRHYLQSKYFTRFSVFDIKTNVLFSQITPFHIFRFLYENKYLILLNNSIFRFLYENTSTRSYKTHLHTQKNSMNTFHRIFIYKSGDYLFSQDVSIQVFSAVWSLTSVFDMGTGVSFIQ